MGSFEGRNDPPWRFWDFFVTAVICIACIPFILGNIVLLCNRHYRPIKTKSVHLTVLSSVGGLICIVATIVVNNPGRKQDSIWAFCTLWTFWLQACFGFSLWLNCLNVRLIVLHSIFNLKRGAKSMKSNLIKLVGLLSPTIILCICASVMHSIRFKPVQAPSAPQNVFPTPQNEGNCSFTHKYWSIAMHSLLILYYLIFIVLSFMLRGAMAQFNEFRENFPLSFQNLESDLKKARETIIRYDDKIKNLEEDIRTIEEKISDLQDQPLEDVFKYMLHELARGLKNRCFPKIDSLVMFNSGFSKIFLLIICLFLLRKTI
ncbi:regulator of G-protein signaling 1 isoform X4 [Cryptomeria japonica]|uniref:regulator of G-protein signaling 1 isoform X4 n=1 Tax=Cryptomeria japonica TaxID=3369 RepID=UPI0025AB66C5|nr:regulator of G-protein signaling 1 isoform X4 [Cryptomeria japonica]